MSEQEKTRTYYKLRCPECDWTTTFNAKKALEREKEKIDAAMHYVEEHGGEIPDHTNFGNHQCPECYDILGLNGTVSCSECGFIPEKVRA